MSETHLAETEETATFREEVLARTEAMVKDKLDREATGHDWWHAARVRATAVRIAKQEDADVFVVDLAALLHDVEDYKFTGDDASGPLFATRWLSSIGVDSATTDHVAQIIGRMSFKGAHVDQLPLTLEGKCLQDADRLDAIGAIGISRVFAFGGHRGRPIHDPCEEPVLHASAESYKSAVGTSINHFHEKLLLLRDRMNTEHGRRLAEARHQVMVGFLRQFHAEWDGLA
jgi:uncharacterized protein